MHGLWMVLASFLFACMGVCVKFAAENFTAGEIVFYRAFFSLLLMWGLVRLRGVPLATPNWRGQLGRGITGFVALYAYFLAITLLPLATAVTLSYTSAIFLALILAFSGWHLTRGMIAALLTGLFGVVWLLKPSFHTDQLMGGLIGLSAGIFASMAYYNVRELGAKGEPESRTVFYFSLISTICSGIWLFFQEIHALDWQSGLLLLGVASFATAAQLAMTRAYTRGRTLVAAVLAYTTVIFASLFGALFFGEVLDLESASAMLLIVLAGVAASHFSRAAPSESD